MSRIGKIIILILEKVCPELSAEVPNGQLIFVHNGTIPEGAVASYSCNDGYKMVGPESKECKEGKGWVPEEEVLCSKN